MRKIIFSFLVWFLLITGEVTSQKSTFNGWMFLNHEQKLSKKWSFLSDIQIRSGDQWKRIETVLIRPGIQFKFSKAHSAAVGYAYFANWEKVNGKRSFDLEHRSWAQYNIAIKLGKTEMNNRIRLEQRFLQTANIFEFAQRIRYYLRLQIPLTNTSEFIKGAFFVLQDEIFLNVQNKKYVNNNFLDQNRFFSSLGYRFNKGIAVEGGYMYRYLLENKRVHNHILQLVFTTSF